MKFALVILLTCYGVGSQRTDLMHKGIPGVIKTDLGTITFSQDVLTVRVDLSPLYNFVSSLRSARVRLTDLLDHYEIGKLNNNTVNLLQAQKERLDMILPTRRKRGIFNFGGDILNLVFGTATEKQVHKVSHKISLLEKWAQERGKVIRMAVDRVNGHSEKLLHLDRAVANLTLLINKERFD